MINKWNILSSFTGGSMATMLDGLLKINQKPAKKRTSKNRKPRKHELTTGDRFNRWTFLNFEPTKYYSESNPSSGVRQVRVRCECGTEKVLAIHSLTSGTSKSCGCLRKEVAREIGKRPYNKNKRYKSN